MERFRDIFRQPGFHALLFCFFLALFCWPLLTIADKAQGGMIFIYLFGVWGVIIVLLGVMALSLEAGSSGKTEDKTGQG